MRGTFRDELPHDLFGRTKLGYLTLGALFFKNSLSSRLAPRKLVPLSLHIMDGWPRRAMKRRRAAIKASVVKSETSSKCTAFSQDCLSPIAHNGTSGLFQSNEPSFSFIDQDEKLLPAPPLFS